MSKRNKSRKMAQRARDYSHTEGVYEHSTDPVTGRPLRGPRIGSRDLSGRGDVLCTRLYNH